MVIDTGIFIEYLRAKNKHKTTLFLIPDSSELFISSVSTYELYAGAISQDRETDLRDLIEGINVLAFTDDVAIKAAEIFRQLKRKNQLIDFRDIFIGATCVVNNLPLLTLNKKHFNRIEGLILV